MTRSPGWHRAANATAGTDPALLLLEIEHVDLAQPIRVVLDNQDLVSAGNTYYAMSFECTLPDDPEHGASTARLALDNIGKIQDGEYDLSIGEWLERSGGGQGATVRMMQVRRSAPDLIEWDVTMDLRDTGIDARTVTGTLGFDDILNQPGVALVYRPDVAPGLF